MAKSTIRDCKGIQPLLSEYVDGMLGEEEAWNIKLHCASCAVCERIASDFAATANLLQALPEEAPSDLFESRLAARIADITLVPRRPSLWERVSDTVYGVWTRPLARPAFAVGAALAAALPVSFVMLNRPHPTVAPTPVAQVHTQTVAPEASVAIKDLWQEHAAYSASEPLGDSASLIASTTGL